MSRRSNESSKNPIAALKKPPIFKYLNRKQLTDIFKYLDIEDLSRLRTTCRRMCNAVEYWVQDLQLFVDWNEGYMEPVFQGNQTASEFKPLTLRTCSPGDFFYPRFPFKSLKILYLCYDDEQGEKLDLSELWQLKYLKVRGAIKLSSNRLSNVTHIDIDDPDLCEKQVFPNLKSFNLNFDVSRFSSQKNTTEQVAVKYAFDKSMDILLDKSRLEKLFEQFNDSATEFMKNYQKEINLPNSKVFIRLRYNTRYEITDHDRRRWYNAWSFLGREDVLPNPNTSVEAGGKRGKIPINPDELSETRQTITERFYNLQFDWEGFELD